MTWKQADDAAREIAAGLVARGIVPGDRVCVLAQTSLEWILCDVGILFAGGVTVPIYPSNTAEQCEFIVRDSGAKIVLVEDAAQLEKILSVRDHLMTVASVVTMLGDAHLDKADAHGRTSVALADVVKGAGDLVMSLEALRAAGRAWLAAHPGELDGHAETVAGDSMFTIIYTSGTTGTPKGVVLTHRNLVAAVASAIRVHADLRRRRPVPLPHARARPRARGRVGGRRARLHVGDLARRPAHQAGPPRDAPRVHGRACRASSRSSTRASVGPRQVEGPAARHHELGARRRQGVLDGGEGGQAAGRLAELPTRHRRQARLLEAARAAGARSLPLPHLGRRAARRRDRRVLPLRGPARPRGLRAHGDDGGRLPQHADALPVRHGRVRRSTSSRRRSPRTARSSCAARRCSGSTTTTPAATAEAVQPDGWFHSGDIGHLEDGFLRITDRKKDLIVTANGKKVAPQPLENALKARSPLVSQVVVYGDKRSYCVALVTLSEDAQKKFASNGNVSGTPPVVASPELTGRAPEGRRRAQRDARALRDDQEVHRPRQRLHRGGGRGHAQPQDQAQGRHRQVPRRHRRDVQGPRGRLRRRGLTKLTN